MIDKTVFSINLWDVYLKEGRQCTEEGDLDGAIERFTAALEKAEGYGDDDPRVATTKRCLAEVYARRGEYDKAKDLYTDSLELLEAELGQDSQALLKTLSSYAECLAHTGEAEKLAAIKSRISDIQSKCSDQLVTSDIFEEEIPPDAGEKPMTAEQRMRIMELIQRPEIPEHVRDKVLARLGDQPSYQWAHDIQGKLRQLIVRSYQPISLRGDEELDIDVD